MQKLKSARLYALVSGIILFCLGFFSLAFRTTDSIPDFYLMLSLILGLWGIIASTRPNL